MSHLGKQAVTIRVPRLTLRTRLTVLYGALFSASVAAVVAVSELFWPNLLREHTSQAAPAGSAPAAVKIPTRSHDCVRFMIGPSCEAGGAMKLLLES